jgi:hypothetical protein
MFTNFAEALAALGPNAGARIINAARPTSDYLLNTFLPERLMTDYSVNAANMLVRTTMAGMVSMDSPYPPGGLVELQTFFEQSLKLGISNRMIEAQIRQLQQLLMGLQLAGSLTNDFLQREAFNFYQKTVVQAILDRAEWMRAQAMIYGAINWTFNQKPVSVSYGIPAGNFLTTRTDANNDSYSDTGSKFWEDVANAQGILRYNLRGAVMNTATYLKILSQPANNIIVLAQSNNSVTVTRTTSRSGNTVQDNDARYTMQFVLYDREAEVMDTTPPNLGKTEIKKFVPDGKIIYIGANTASGYVVGEGSTRNPRADMEIGYHHIAPTVEGGGAPGRWGRMYVPEGYPMQLIAEGASNELPVILAPEKICIATTEMLP